MAPRTDNVWKRSDLVGMFLEGVRGAIPLAQEQLDIMLRLIGASGRPIRAFLDLGCGDGVLSAAVLSRHPGAQAVLIDFSEPMLDAARARLAGHTPPPVIINADYGSPAWTASVEGPFDAVVSGYSIHHQTDERKQEVYAEILGLLNPGGSFVNVEHVASATPWVEALHDDIFIDHLHLRHPEKSRQDVADTYYYRPDKSANILAPVEAQCQWLRDIGFTDVDCYLKIFELAVFGGRKP